LSPIRRTDVEVFDLGGPVRRKGHFNAGAGGKPAIMGLARPCFFPETLFFFGNREIFQEKQGAD
jgi:hypothetical protein